MSPPEIAVTVSVRLTPDEPKRGCDDGNDDATLRRIGSAVATEPATIVATAAATKVSLFMVSSRFLKDRKVMQWFLKYYNSNF
jgi:hypothetical protein